MSLLEAAACGRPMVATDVPGCREIVRPGETGLLVPVDDRTRRSPPPSRRWPRRRSCARGMARPPAGSLSSASPPTRSAGRPLISIAVSWDDASRMNSAELGLIVVGSRRHQRGHHRAAAAVAAALRPRPSQRAVVAPRADAARRRHRRHRRDRRGARRGSRAAACADPASLALARSSPCRSSRWSAPPTTSGPSASRRACCCRRSPSA